MEAKVIYGKSGNVIGIETHCLTEEEKVSHEQQWEKYDPYDGWFLEPEELFPEQFANEDDADAEYQIERVSGRRHGRKVLFAQLHVGGRLGKFESTPAYVEGTTEPRYTLGRSTDWHGSLDDAITAANKSFRMKSKNDKYWKERLIVRSGNKVEVIDLWKLNSCVDSSWID